MAYDYLEWVNESAWDYYDPDIEYDDEDEFYIDEEYEGTWLAVVEDDFRNYEASEKWPED